MISNYILKEVFHLPLKFWNNFPFFKKHQVSVSDNIATFPKLPRSLRVRSLHCRRAYTKSCVNQSFAHSVISQRFWMRRFCIFWMSRFCSLGSWELKVCWFFLFICDEGHKVLPNFGQRDCLVMNPKANHLNGWTFTVKNLVSGK